MSENSGPAPRQRRGMKVRGYRLRLAIIVQAICATAFAIGMARRNSLAVAIVGFCVMAIPAWALILTIAFTRWIARSQGPSDAPDADAIQPRP
jgi:hypothetical protein